MTTVGAIARRGWALVILLMVIGGVVGMSVGNSKPTTYTATQRGFVVVNNSGTSGGDAFNAGQAAQARMASYAALATAPAVTSRVASALNVKLSPEEIAKDLSVSFPPGTLVLVIKGDAPWVEVSAVVACFSVADSRAKLGAVGLGGGALGGVHWRERERERLSYYELLCVCVVVVGVDGSKAKLRLFFY